MNYECDKVLCRLLVSQVLLMGFAIGVLYQSIKWYRDAVNVIIEQRDIIQDQKKKIWDLEHEHNQQPPPPAFFLPHGGRGQRPV